MEKEEDDEEVYGCVGGCGGDIRSFILVDDVLFNRPNTTKMNKQTE